MTELAEIFRQHGAAYQTKFADRLLPSHRQAMRAILNCRTEVLGVMCITVTTAAKIVTAIILAAIDIVPNARMRLLKSG